MVRMTKMFLAFYVQMSFEPLLDVIRPDVGTQHSNLKRQGIGRLGRPLNFFLYKIRYESC